MKAARHEMLAVKTDVTDRDQVSKAVKLTLETFGRIDVIVNNAGISYFGTIEKLPIEEFDRLIRTNVDGMLHVSQSAIPALKETQGMIVNISSGLSKRALPFLSAYSSAKSMMDALSDGMRLELRRYGVRVLNYCPPETDTEIFDVTKSQPGLDQRQAGDRKKAKAEDVASRIVQAIIDEKREIVEGKFLQIMNFLLPSCLIAYFTKAWFKRYSKIDGFIRPIGWRSDSPLR